jgi:transketolase
MPCFEIFDKQDESYKESILGDSKILKVAVEAGISQGWHKIIGANGIFIGMNDFGASGKAEDLFEYFGITSEAICKKIADRIAS